LFDIFILAFKVNKFNNKKSYLFNNKFKKKYINQQAKQINASKK